MDNAPYEVQAGEEQLLQLDSDQEGNDEQPQVGEMTLKPSYTAIDFNNGQESKSIYLEKVGKGLLDPNFTRDEIRRIEDMKRTWRQRADTIT